MNVFNQPAGFVKSSDALEPEFAKDLRARADEVFRFEKIADDVWRDIGIS